MTIPSLGELILGLVLGFAVGFMLRRTTGEVRVRVGYIAAIVIALLLYGAYDFYRYSLGGYETKLISGSFLCAVIGIILGREIGRRLTGDHNNG